MSRKKHHIVARDLAVADIVIQFCKEFEWWGYRGKGITIKYSDEPPIVKANVRIIGLKEYHVEIFLQKTDSSTNWEVFRFNIYSDSPFQINLFGLHDAFITEACLGVKCQAQGDHVFMLSRYKLFDGPYISF